MEGQKQSVSIPIAAERTAAIWLAILYPLILFAYALLKNREMTQKDWDDGAKLAMLIFLVVLAVVSYIGVLYNCLAKLHIAPDGITVTIFGFCIRHVPAEGIRFVTGIRYRRRAHKIGLIAICGYTLAELTDLAVKTKPQILRNSREFWHGEWAGEYLHRLARRTLRLDKKIFWLQWDASRVKVLQEMYPQAQWLDCTQEKIFDEQLKS